MPDSGVLTQINSARAAAYVRRHQILIDIADGKRTIESVVDEAGSDRIVAKITLRSMLVAHPAIGKRRATTIMNRLHAAYPSKGGEKNRVLLLWLWDGRVDSAQRRSMLFELVHDIPFGPPHSTFPYRRVVVPL